MISKTSIYPYLLVFWPSCMPFLTEGKNLSAFLFIVLSLFIIINKRFIKINFNYIFYSFIIYISYLLLNILINGYIYQSWNNFTEILRIFCVIIAFLLGKNFIFESFNIKYFTFTFIVLSLMLSISFYIPIFINHFYFPKIIRLSWFSVGVNYLFGYIILFFLFFKIKEFKFSSNLLLYSLFLSLIAIQLFSSGSRTTLIVVSFFLLLNFAFYNRKMFIFFASLIIVVPFINLNFLQTYHHITRLFDIIKIVLSLDYDAFLSIHSFAKRSVNLIYVKELIENSPVFGHGAGKSIIKVIDSNYYMTIFRYGYVGLILELVFILSVFIKIITNKNIPLSFCIAVVCFLLSFITLATLYELRCTYIFFFICGLVCNLSFKDTVNTKTYNLKIL